ncbi:MAG: EamA family transporter [Wenzhouxiangellaceae bacterium]
MMLNNASLYLISVVLWGSTWLAISYQLGVVSLEISLVYRYGLATLVLFGWCWWRGLNLSFSRRDHGLFMLLGLFLFSLNYIGTYSAQQYIPSALNAVVFSTMMWMNVINSRWFFGTRIEPRVYLGATLGMAGIITLFWPQLRAVDWSDSTLLGMVYCLLGAALASLGNMVSQQAQRHSLPVIQANAWGMLYGTLFTLLIAMLRGRELSFDWRPEYLLSLLYLALFGSVIAFGTYLQLLGRIGAHRAGYAVVMFPLVAVALSHWFEGLMLEWHLLLGMGLILFGNVIVLGGLHWLGRSLRQRWRPRKTPLPAPACSADVNA